MLTPFVYAIEVPNNGVYRDTFTYKIDGVAQVITGGAFKMQVRPSAGDTSTPLLSLTATPTAGGSKIYITDGPNGKFQILIGNADIIALPQVGTPVSNPDAWVYDVVYTEPGPSTDFYPIMKGSFTRNEGVTIP